MGRGPEIGFQNVGYSTCRTRSSESISTVLNPAPAIPVASRILSTRPNTEDEEDAEPPRTAGRVSDAERHRADVGTVLIERSSGGQHLAAFQAFEDSTDSRH
ncbi:hypothetical protein EVAR_75346_1 [Eumeta japonica]|uniref:Uncharacterized protein n=1 Tax=Eumeta variegata TaxID=151549 RepID=A0A4C1YE56_EUMVA|nr:hypothetical protein EVAR_75346_1 [Eumeta japonica]